MAFHHHVSQTTASVSLFALIVGIDRYADPNLPDLKCAVHDAKRLNAFLRDRLQVPHQNIRLLTDGQATYSGILSAFRTHLIENRFIPRGNPILFYYAGHGSRFFTPGGWPTDDGNCESICPSNRNTPGIDGKIVGDIVDWELGKLLLELAGVKYNNITVIMDCCHSGSGTRGRQLPEKIPNKTQEIFQEAAALGYFPRYAPPIEDPAFLAVVNIPANLNVTSSRYFPSLYRGTSSHILLAATRQNELAWEQSTKTVTRGLFTSHLLAKLEKIDLPRTSYLSLMSDIGPFEVTLKPGMSFSQTPQLEGKMENQRRVLFDGKALGVDKRLIPMTRIGPTNLVNNRRHLEVGTMCLEAGAIHGVSDATELTVRRNQFHSGSSQPLGQVIVAEVNGVWSIVKPKMEGFAPPSNCYAIISYLANPPFKLALRPPLNDPERHVQFEADLAKRASGNRGDMDGDMHIIRTEPEAAKLVASIAENEIVLERCDSLISQYCPREITWKRISDRSDWEVINIAARFDFYLYHENPTHPYANKVSVELLRANITSQADPPLQDAPITNSNTLIDLESNDVARYAVKLNNDSPDDLWCSILYFDPSDYSITCLYTPPSRTMNAPLRSGESFTIGQGSSGVMPFEFFLNEGEESDTGFLKVMISDVYADLEMLEQASGFVFVPSETRQRGPLVAGKGLWDTLVLVIRVNAVTASGTGGKS